MENVTKTFGVRSAVPRTVRHCYSTLTYSRRNWSQPTSSTQPWERMSQELFSLPDQEWNLQEARLSMPKTSNQCQLENNSRVSYNSPRLRTYEPANHKSVDYRAFKRGFQASRNQSQSLYMSLIE